MPGRRLRPGSPPRLPKELRTAWLLLLLRTEPGHGYVLRRELTARGWAVEPSMLYRALRELEADGLTVSSWQDPAAGPRARIYTITPRGRNALATLAATIERQRGAQEAFLTAYEQATRGRPLGEAPAAPQT